MKKFYAALLLIAMLVTTLVACNPDEPENSQVESKDSLSEVESKGNESIESSVDEPDDECWLPEKKWDVELTWASQYTEGDKTDVHYYEVWCEEDLGDTVSKTVLNRSRWLEDTYGIRINMLWNPEGGAVSYAEKAVSSNLPLDVITSSAFGIGPTLQNGFFYDLAEVNTQFNDGKGWLTLDASYWDQNAIRDFSIANRVYMLTGDIVLFDDEATWAMFFNRDMVTDLGIEDPYKTVKDGKWTLDTLYGYCTEYTVPDGDELTWDKDANHRWGMVTQAYDCLMFMMGCGQSIITKDSNDLPIIHVTEQRHIDITQKVCAMFDDKNHVGLADNYGRYDSGVYGVEVGIFANGHALFMPHSMTFLNNPSIKEATFELGIIPMPKADDLQDEYSSSSNVYSLQMVAIPIINKDNLEPTLYALEAMAWYGQRYVKPEYYEKVLKLQKFKSEDAEEMLDLVFNNRTYDMGIAYNWSDMIQFYNNLRGSGGDFASFWESKRDAYEDAVQSAIDTFTVKS